MAFRRLLIGLELVLLFLLFSCGEIKKPIQPVYHFEMGKSIFYKLDTKLSLDADAGFIKYNGDVEVSADVEMKAVETNEYGYKIEFDIRNPIITGGDGRFINLAVTAGLNYLRTWFATIYLSDKGKTTVFMDNKIVEGLNAYSQVIFPEFSDMDKIKTGLTDTKKFGAKLQNNEYMMVFQHQWEMKDQRLETLLLGNQVKIGLFNKEDYEKTVEPASVGDITFDFNDEFNAVTGQLTKKDGTILIGLNLVLKQDFLSYIVSLKGKGSLSMQLADRPL